MKGNERLIAALQQAIQLDSDVELIKLLHFICTMDDPAYTQDEDVAEQLELENKITKKVGKIYKLRKPTDVNVSDDITNLGKSFYDFTKENEQIAYDRFKTRMDGKIFCNLTETLSYSEFIERFTCEFCYDDEAPRDITIINHCSQFVDIIRFRHNNAYVIGKKGDKYVAMHLYTCKIPDFREMFDDVTWNLGVNCGDKAGWAADIFDEWFSVVIDWEVYPRFVDYTRKITYGVWYRPAKQEAEIFDVNQTVEIFHELMQKSNRIFSTWNGLIYDDKTLKL